MLPEAGGVHVHTSGRRWPGGRLRGGGRVLLHTDRGPGGRRAAPRGRTAPAQLFGERVERHKHVQRAVPGQLDAAGDGRAHALPGQPGAHRQKGLRRPDHRGDVVVLRRAHVLPVHIHHEWLRQRSAQDNAGQGRHRRVRRFRHTPVRALLPEHGKGA